MLHWRSFLGQAKLHVVIVLDTEGSQYLIFRCLQPIAT